MGGLVEVVFGVDWFCWGYVFVVFDYELIYMAGELLFFIFVYVGGDLILVINMLSGEWVCNDDEIGFNLGIVFDNLESGVYDIWVGIYFEDDFF